MFSLEDKKSNLLDVKVKDYGECSFCLDEENKETLKIPWNIYSQWLYIIQNMSGREWGAVFWVKDNAITSFKIPKQKVNSTECEFEEDLGGDGIVHSHHDMGAFHSAQDDHHARNLYSYSIVLTNQKGYAATKRIKLTCGGFGYLKVELHLTGCPEISLAKISDKIALHSVSPAQNTEKQSEFNLQDVPCENCTTKDCQNCGYFYSAQFPCENCISFKCKECRLTKDMNISEALPFCDLCEDYDFCPSCEKLAKYLENYPQDRKQFGHLIANKT